MHGQNLIPGKKWIGAFVIRANLLQAASAPPIVFQIECLPLFLSVAGNEKYGCLETVLFEQGEPVRPYAASAIINRLEKRFFRNPLSGGQEFVEFVTGNGLVAVRGQKLQLFFERIGLYGVEGKNGDFVLQRQWRFRGDKIRIRFATEGIYFEFDFNPMTFYFFEHGDVSDLIWQPLAGGARFSIGFPAAPSDGPSA
jgi:hypothetical protein